MHRTLKAALLAAASVTALPAHAQEEEIVVTATRSPAPAAQLPARIDVIDREDFEARGDIAVAEALGSPAVQGGGVGQQASLFLRGANSKHTLALFDGIRLNEAASPNAAYDFGQDSLGALERIEVLRGPASAIYGSDAVAGVVNLIPRRGGETGFEPFLEASFGSHETRTVLIGAAGSASGFSYGVSAEAFDTEGYDVTPERMATHTGDTDGAYIATLAASARQEFGAFGVDALVRARDSTAEYDTFSGGAFFDLRADDPDLENEATQAIWRLGADWSGGDVDVRISGGQVESDRSETDGGTRTNAADSTRAFADLVAHYRFGAGVLTGGVAYERNAIDTQPQFASPLSAEEDQIGAYAIGQFDLAPWLAATASVRVDDFEGFGAHTTYSLGAVATFGDARVFVSHGTAFKAPSLSERFETSFFNIGNPDLAPEDATSWEVGADWAMGAARVGVSYYQTRIGNLIEYDFGALQNINVGEAEIDGAEAYVELAPTQWATLRLDYAWTDARNGLTGAQLIRRPEHAWNAELQLVPVERLRLTLGWSHVGERLDVTYSDAGAFISSAGEGDAYGIGAVAVTYDLDEHAQLFARVSNITDESYEQPAAFAGAPRAGSVGLRARY